LGPHYNGGPHARGHRPRPRQPARPRPGRRAHRQPRLGLGQGHRRHLRRAARRGPDHRDDHPRHGPGPSRLARRPDPRRKDRGRRRRCRVGERASAQSPVDTAGCKWLPLTSHRRSRPGRARAPGPILPSRCGRAGGDTGPCSAVRLAGRQGVTPSQPSLRYVLENSSSTLPLGWVATRDSASARPFISRSAPASAREEVPRADRRT
jgi:hypothetical protein